MEVPHCGLGDGLALLWHENINLAVQTFSPHHIDAFFTEDGVQWRFIGFYDHPETVKRGESWDILCHLHSVGNFPWLIKGDLTKFYIMMNIGGMVHSLCLRLLNSNMLLMIVLS